MDHANLPSVANAQLPETYENAKTALSECSSIDECKDWSDKALASYARQSDDCSLNKMAMRIQARAIRRCGELLRQIKSAHGKNQNNSEGDHTNVLSRKKAGDDAGMSTRQQNTAKRVASIPEDEFNAIRCLANPGKSRHSYDLASHDMELEWDAARARVRAERKCGELLAGVTPR